MRSYQRIPFIYLLVSVGWLIVSDGLLFLLPIDLMLDRWVTSLLKGIAFVTITTSVLYYLLRRAYRHRAMMSHRLNKQSEAYQRTETQLTVRERMYQMLLKCNQAQFRADDEQELFQSICEIVVTTGGYRLCWIGKAQDDKTVQPIAWSGHNAQYLDAIHVRWDDSARGRGPTGRAIRTGEPVFTPHILTTDEYEPWQNEAIRRGYRSSIALPLNTSDDVWGSLNIYAATENAFSDGEIELLVEMANNLSYSLQALQARSALLTTLDELRHERDRLNRITETSPVGILVLNTEGQITFTNHQAVDILDLGDNEIKAHRFTSPEWQITDFEGNAIPKEELPFNRVVQTGEAVFDAEHAIRLRDDDDPLMLLSVNAAPIFDQDGQVNRVVATIEDITDRITTQRQLQRREELFRLLAENASDIIYRMRLHPEPQFEYVSPAATTITGYTPEEHYADPQLVYQLVHPDDRDLFQQATAMPSSNPLVLRWIRKDDTVIWTEQKNNAIFDDDGRMIAIEGIVRDITKRKQTEEALRESRERYRLLAELTFEGIVLHRNGKIIDANSSLLNMFGYQLNDILSEQAIDLLFPPDAQQTVYDKVNSHYTSPYETEAVRKDGSRFPVEIEARQLNSELRVASLRDITQRKQAEVIALENERLKVRFQEEQEQNALIQRIISALSHDLRTPLTVIQASKDILSRYSDRISPDKRQEKLDTIGRQIQFALELLDDTVQMARGNLNERAFDPTPVNLAVLCQVSVAEIQAATDKHHELLFNNASGVETVLVDEVLVSRILINLLSNAIKYSPDDRPIQLELDQEEEWLILRVIDAGMGINDEDLEHIFEPFYRTDEAQSVHGTGLGLSIIQDCVQRHQGRIHVESEIGVGSIFTVELPVHPQLGDTPIPS